MSDAICILSSFVWLFICITHVTIQSRFWKVYLVCGIVHICILIAWLFTILR